MKLRIYALLYFAIAFSPTIGLSQTRSLYSNLANPAIGLNALFSGNVAPDLDEPYGVHFDAAEVSFVSEVDPYWTLWANIAFTAEEVDPEEIWAQTTRLPDVALKVGKMRATFGRHGTLHTHAFPFALSPIIIANTLGDEGFKDAGVEASWLTPVSWYMELTAGAYGPMDLSDENPLDFGSTDHGNIPFGGHLKNQLDLTDYTTVEFGLSGLSGKGADGHQRTTYGADVTFRNVPARQSNQRGWILAGEFLGKGARVDGKWADEQRGWFASFQYRLSQTWWCGVRGEQAFDSYMAVLIDPNSGDPVTGDMTRGSVNIAWAPSEFSYIRLDYSYAQANDHNGLEPLDRRLILQLDYTIGHHPPHAY